MIFVDETIWLPSAGTTSEQSFWSGIGKNGTDFSHLHFEVLSGSNSTVAIEHIYASTGMKTYALIDEPIPNPTTGALSTSVEVTWSDAENGWVIPTFGIAFSRKAEGTGLTNVWVALASDGTRERVVWKAVQYSGEPEARFRWVSANNSSMEWNPTEKKFELQQSIS